MSAMARALFLFALSTAVLAIPPAPPVSPLHGLEPRANVCDAVKNVVAVLRLDRQAAPFCSSVLHITPATVTVTATSTPSPVVVTQTVVGTSTATATNVALSTTVDSTTETITAVATAVELVTTTITVTQNVAATTTVVVGQTNTRTVPVTATALVITTVVPLVKRTAPSPCPNALKGVASSLVSKACSCLALPTSTVTSTATVAGPAPTSTVTATGTVTVTQTVTAVSQVVVQTTIDVTVIRTATVTSEATVRATVTAVTGTQEVDVTSTTVVDQTVTTTVTSVATVTAGATCGVNLVANGDFPQPQYAPFVLSSTGNANPQFNAGCGTDPYCPLFIVNNGGGSETLTQTVATFPGQVYTLSFLYNNFGASPGASLACSVDAAGAAPVAANLGTVTGTRFVLASGTFRATGASTVLTCKGSTTGNLASNIQAIHIMC